MKSLMKKSEVERSAVEWFARMQSDARTLEDDAALRQWFAQDPEHELEYREVEAFWHSLENHKADAPIQAMRQAALADAEQAARDHQRQSVRWFALAASVAALLLGGTLLFSPLTWSESSYATGIGDRYSVKLTDGSELTLNTDTALHVRYTPWGRQVTLDRGEAYFHVAHSWLGKLRPFTVNADVSRVRAIGTEFVVYRRAKDVQVTLIEGRIEVSGSTLSKAAAGVQLANQRQLVAGQRVEVSSQGVSEVESTRSALTAPWREGSLQFDNDTLADVLEEVNRYSPTKLIVLDKGLSQLRISGVFRTGQIEPLARALEATFPLGVVDTSEGNLLLVPKLATARGDAAR